MISAVVRVDCTGCHLGQEQNENYYTGFVAVCATLCCATFLRVQPEFLVSGSESALPGTLAIVVERVPGTCVGFLHGTPTVRCGNATTTSRSRYRVPRTHEDAPVLGTISHTPLQPASG
eukprot:59860-Rhodomonas_salina.1